MNNRKCDFCSNFDFSLYSWVPDSCGVRILYADSSRFPRKEQFNFCPVCGKPRKGVQKRRSSPVDESTDLFIAAYEAYLQRRGITHEEDETLA